MSSQEVVARRRKKCVNDHPASAKELKIEEGKGERRNRETEKKGGERERERGEKRMGDYGGTAGPGIASSRCSPKGKITMVGESTVANC
ncbi:MAG: hypothetical protein LBE67_10440 [Kocuria palustris]|jgi:hypothetical protein|nr:hypothetical protein [Kocuria palustris]